MKSVEAIKNLKFKNGQVLNAKELNTMVYSIRALLKEVNKLRRFSSKGKRTKK